MASSSSSSSQQQVPPSSSRNLSNEQAWQKLLLENSKPKTPAQIKAAGEVKVKVGVLWLVGTTSAVLALFGGVAFFTIPEKAQDLWVIIGPIITAALTGTLGYLTGEKNSSK